jgi:dynein heavy chain
VRITRIMRQQRGHFMLVGVGGSGKKSLSELASVLAGARMMKVEPQKKYGKKEFRIDIFNIMLQAGSSN